MSLFVAYLVCYCDVLPAQRASFQKDSFPMRFSAASLATAVNKRDREATAMVLDSVIDLAELHGVTIDAIPIVEIITTLHCTTEELVELLLPQTG